MNPATFNMIAEAIEMERKRQNEQWGAQSHSHETWLAILLEEIGEVAKSVLQDKPMEDLQQEIIQAAAVCFVWLEQTEDAPVAT